MSAGVNRTLIYSGLLRKSPPEEKVEKNYKWRKRFFKLYSDQSLEYFKNEGDTKPLKEGIALNYCIKIMETKGDYLKYLRKTKYKYPFCIKMPDRCYHVAARSETERAIWKKQLKTVCGFTEHDTLQLPIPMEVSPIPTRHSSISSNQSTATNSSTTPSSVCRLTVEKLDPEVWSSSEDEQQRDESFSDLSSERILPPLPSVSERSRSSTYSTPNSLYDFPRHSEETHISIIYDTPPQPRPSPWKSMSVKQPRSTKLVTTEPKTFNIGYERMAPSQPDEDYIQMDEKLQHPQEIKVFRSPGNKKLFSTLPVAKPVIQPHAIISSTLPPGSPLPIVNDDEPLQRIPDVKNKIVQEVKTFNPVEKAPVVCREKKPPQQSPVIDRTKKPKKQQSYVIESPRKRLTQKSTSFDFSFSSIHRMSNETDYVQHNFQNSHNNNSVHLNIEEFDQIDGSTYSNTDALMGGFDEDPNGAYDNLVDRRCPNMPSPICNGFQKKSCDNYDNVNKHHAISNTNSCYAGYNNEHLNNIDYKIEALPEEPANIDYDDCAMSYENVQARHSASESITYVEVNTGGTDSVFEENPDVGETRNGIHYILVDAVKSEAVKKLR